MSLCSFYRSCQFSLENKVHWHCFACQLLWFNYATYQFTFSDSWFLILFQALQDLDLHRQNLLTKQSRNLRGSRWLDTQKAWQQKREHIKNNLPLENRASKHQKHWGNRWFDTCIPAHSLGLGGVDYKLNCGVGEKGYKTKQRQEVKLFAREMVRKENSKWH